MNITKLLTKSILTGVIAGIVISSLIGAGAYFYISKSAWAPIQEVEAKSTEFVNTELLQGQGSATVKVTGKEGDLYKLEVNYNGQKIDSFVSKDGKRFFPQSFEILKVTTANKSDNQPEAQPATDNISQKTDKPTVELFVMSHCPYGVQMEKGILPVVKTLGDKIDFKIKFVDYAMHGEKELKEQLSQYCIQKEQSTKLLAYLDVFLKEGDSETSLSQAGVDKNKLQGCIQKTDKEFKVLDNFNNKVGFKGNYAGFEIFKTENEKYGVQGSPTLVINGTQSQSGRDSNSLLKSICSSFTNQPKECSTVLSSEAPSPGFGGGTAPAGGAAAPACATN
ncbi:MAG: hypothetical protein UT86_C0003G0101 [Candidatus Magasanikbacteria bacterium GW2011_GWC2_40_17]|uniref:Uncharacterized protein n=1 Tax=Candidatus Magasanikbacteria bacterium GW2011_GWA2_42_32 TaxID=1619039 RepID=A0A0G1A7T1_9BACT|nr:MAG: hypothetical protein UT86_C0003G0101 [Candidatus Magasanikbacteria bacterium GW2011_GWC2_40_17]KKS57004.1 MAG: hypothetical protein UV20_C0004G0100 [Candidatus Magasanikbacteria bacterium GW2011_GWA2_42_32]OGH85731.1 MAG: hypothetical protein A2294_03840 [Candidatus Magasanikbacteria bacterium RIFOXYB2_FULL_38_10]